MQRSATAPGDPGAEPGRVWCIGDWAKIDPRTGNVLELGESGEALSRRNEVWDAGSELVLLRGARNEVLAFQIVVESLGAPVHKIFVTAQDFEGPVRLDAHRHVQFFRELYVPAKGEWHPDALLPFELGEALPFSVPERDASIPGQRVAVVWVDVYIPKGIPAGEYEATFRVSYRSVFKLSEFTIRLQVVDLTLPDRLSLEVDLMSYGYLGIARGFPDVVVDSPRYRAIEREFYRMAHAHRTTFAMAPHNYDEAMPKGIAPPLRGVGDRISVAGWADWDARFGPLLDGSAFEDLPRGGLPVNHFFLPFGLEYPSSFRYWGTDRYEVENRSIIAEFIYHIVQEGWVDPLYIVYYNAEKRYGYYPWNLCEPRSEEDVEALRYLSSVVHGSLHSHPGLRTMLRMDINHFHCATHEGCLPNIEQRLRGHFDLWNISDSHWNDQTAPVIQDLVKTDGIQAWFYLGASRIRETLQKMHDYPWLAWWRGAQGISFWNTTDWLDWDKDGAVTDPYEVANEQYQGASILMYPGSKFGLDGPIGSMRLKVLRRGLQEYELLQLLAKRKGRQTAQNLVATTFPCPPQNWHTQRNRLLALLVK